MNSNVSRERKRNIFAEFLTKRTVWPAFCAAFLACALLLSCVTFAAAPTRARVDFSGGGFSGEAARYKFNLPASWTGKDISPYVYAERGELPAKLTGVLEVVNFYCSSVSGKNRPALMFSLYVFKDKYYKEEYGFELLKRGVNYAFAVIYPETAAFSNNAADRKLYKDAFEPVSAAEKVKALITQSDTDAGISTRIYVNYSSIMSVPPLVIDGLYFVPLRDVCEALGCVVTWNGWDWSVTISNGPAFYDRFYMSGAVFTTPKGIRMKNIDGRIYAQTAYFSAVMKKTVEVDGLGNVYIYR